MSKETTKKKNTTTKQSPKKTNKKGQGTRSKARARQKQKLMITGILAVVLLLVIGIAIFVLGGFGQSVGTENSIYILEDGKIVSTNVEDFDEDSYDKGDLKAYMKEVINVYNEKQGANVVKQQTFRLKNDVATSVLQYEDAQVFTDFYGKELFVGTIAEAMAAGYEFDMVFADVTGKEPLETTSETFLNEEGLKVAIVKANTKVMVEGTILYVTPDKVESLGADYLIIKEGASLELKEADSTESTEAAAGVDEGDLLEGMVFEFEEPEAIDREYTDSYTYIIYKTAE